MSTSITRGKRQEPLPAVLYPFRGLLHLAHNPKPIALPILSSALKASLFSLLAIVPLFKYGMGPQSRFLSRLFLELRPQDQGRSFVHSGAALSAGLLCVVESFAIMGQLSDYFVGSVRDRFFDAILKERGGLPKKKDEKTPAVPSADQLVKDLQVAADGAKRDIEDAKRGLAEARNMTAEEVALKAHHFLSPVNIMVRNAQNDSAWQLFFMRPALFFVTLPLNAIPVVGYSAFITIQALPKGGTVHKRYFDLHNWSSARRQRRIEKGFWNYLQFGIVATVLEMIPFAGFVFSYTNHIG